MKEQNSKKKKVITAVVATVMAAALLLGGTFAWQSISQTALNEKDDTINPGGRLHDDFNGTNKDIYVENFGDKNIYARVRLDEYFEITINKGTVIETVKKITPTAINGDTNTYLTHIFGSENATDEYWNWTIGGQTKYMPTFNKNKDSLAADINGTYEQNFDDYVDYNIVDVKEDDAIYDTDDNDIEDDGVTTIQETHNTKDTLAASLISMSEWLQRLENGEDTDNYWVYDTDGWVYWSSAIEPETATGLLLDEIELTKIMDDDYYYAINVTAQFITADDIGNADDTGFYTDRMQAPSDDALTLLEKIGVDVPKKLTYSVVSPDNWNGGLSRGESVTLKVNGNYTADDLTWEIVGSGATCRFTCVENEDGSATITHASGIHGSGNYVKVSLTSDPTVYLIIGISCNNQ